MKTKLGWVLETEFSKNNMHALQVSKLKNVTSLKNLCTPLVKRINT